MVIAVVKFFARGTISNGPICKNAYWEPKEIRVYHGKVKELLRKINPTMVGKLII